VQSDFNTSSGTSLQLLHGLSRTHVR